MKGAAPDETAKAIAPLSLPQVAGVGVPDMSGVAFIVTSILSVATHPFESVAWTVIV